MHKYLSISAAPLAPKSTAVPVLSRCSGAKLITISLKWKKHENVGKYMQKFRSGAGVEAFRDLTFLRYLLNQTR